jgi:hypothetical protein
MLAIVTVPHHSVMTAGLSPLVARRSSLHSLETVCRRSRRHRSRHLA